MYFSELILWEIKYVKYIVILVHKNVTIEKIIGKNAVVLTHTFASQKAPETLIVSQRMKVSMIIKRLQTSPAMRLQNEWIQTSQIVIWFGLKDMIVKLFFIFVK